MEGEGLRACVFETSGYGEAIQARDRLGLSWAPGSEQAGEAQRSIGACGSVLLFSKVNKLFFWIL